MLERSSRFPKLKEKSLTFVGPSTYVIKDKQIKESWSPFGTTKERFPPLKSSGNPSPSEYYSKFRLHRIIGGTSLGYKGPRECLVPPKYNLPSLLTHRRETPEPPRPKPKIYKASMRAPSICSKPKEDFKKVLLEISQAIELPEYLHFPGEVSKITRKYKGNTWSKYKAKRDFKYGIKEGPGPSDYFIEDSSAKTKAVQKPQVPAKKESMFRSVQTISVETMGGDTICSSELLDTSCDYVYKCISFNKTGTFSKANRFHYKQDDSPAPWDYDPTKSKCIRKKVYKDVGFYSLERRFPCKTKYGRTPGPSDYNVTIGTIKENSCAKVPKYWGVKVVPFQSSSGRCTAITKEELDPTPGPGDYDTTTPTCERQYYCVHKFSAMSSPFPRFPVKKPDCEQKTYYDVGAAFKASVLKKSHHKGPQVPFGSNAPRVTMLGSEGGLDHNSGFHHPRVDTHFDPAHGGVVSMKVRKYSIKKDEKDCRPPINIHPMYLTCFYPKTHNVTLKKSFKPKPRKNNCRPVKKILNCFLPLDVCSL